MSIKERIKTIEDTIQKKWNVCDRLHTLLDMVPIIAEIKQIKGIVGNDGEDAVALDDVIRQLTARIEGEHEIADMECNSCVLSGSDGEVKAWWDSVYSTSDDLLCELSYIH